MAPAHKVLTISATIILLSLQTAALRADYSEKPLNGYVDLGYRYRSDGNVSDQDLFQTLSLDYFRPWKSLGENSEVGFVFYGSMQEDIDRHPAEDEFDPFREIADTYDNSFGSWVYLAYAELSTDKLIQKVRLGRQESFELDPVTFDGALVTVKAHKGLAITAFGGLPANIYEGDDRRNGDSIGGAYLDWRFLSHLSFLVGYMNLRDRVELLDGSKDTLHQDLEVAQASWRIARTTNILARASMIGSDFRDATLRGTYYNYKKDLRITAYYYQLALRREAAPLTDDPFSILLGDYKPYYQGGATVYKGIRERYGVEGGMTFRELEDFNHETLFNHSYQRYFASLYYYKRPFESSTWVIGGDFWISPHDVQTQSYRGEYSQKIGKRGRFQAGTAYQLFKIDEYIGTEQENVQYYYVGLTVPTSQHTSFRLDYSFDDGSLREVDTLKAGLKYEF